VRARAAWLVLALAGCASQGAPAPGAPALELGTGTWRFEPVTDGQTIPLVHGAQGGWHFWVAVRASDVDADAGSLTVEIEPADESAPATSATVGIRFDPPDAEGGRNYLGWPEILSDPACAVGRTFRVRATVTFPNGTHASDERWVVPGPGDYPPPACTTGAP
jgi:hypothetical protein